MGNINYVIHKPEAQGIVALSSQADRATATDNMYRKAFCRAFSATFGNIRIASSNFRRANIFPFCVVHGLIEAYPVNKSLVKSLQFAINSYFAYQRFFVNSRMCHSVLLFCVECH